MLNGLSVEDLKTDFYQAKHRNKLLTEVFYLTGDIEKYGTGYIRLRNWLKEYPKLRYNMKDFGDFFRIELVELPVTPPVTPPVMQLVAIFEKEMSRREIQDKLALANKKHFLRLYLQAGIKQGMVEMTIPDKPNSRLQKYRLTGKGTELQQTIR